jgi:hypothetical protein
MSHVFASPRQASSAGRSGRVQDKDNELIEVPVNIAPSTECSRWPEVLRHHGWRAFAKTSRQQIGSRTDWLLKNEQHVFAFHQLDRVACPQKVQLPPEKAEQILRLFAVAGLAHQ